MSAMPVGGVEVLAFYKSFRFRDRHPFPGYWGAFLFDVGIASLAQHLIAAGLAAPVSEVRQLAADVLLTHERYHFWIDAWTLQQEVLPVEAWHKRYVYYRHRVRDVALTENDVEESLANHYVFERLQKRKLSNGVVVRQALKRVLEIAPVPYSIFAFDLHERIRHESHLAFGARNGTLPVVAAVIDRLSAGSLLGGGLHAPNAKHPGVGSARCPAYLVSGLNYASVFAPLLLPSLDELRAFVVRYLDGKEMPKTDHDFFIIDNGEKVKFPNLHVKDTQTHELKNILFKAGMTNREFVLERQRTKFWKKDCPRSPSKQALTAL